MSSAVQLSRHSCRSCKPYKRRGKIERDWPRAVRKQKLASVLEHSEEGENKALLSSSVTKDRRRCC